MFRFLWTDPIKLTGSLHQTHLLMERLSQTPSTGHTLLPEQFSADHMLQRSKAIIKLFKLQTLNALKLLSY